MKNLITTIAFAVIFSFVTFADEIKGGPWNIDFGESTGSVESKIRQSNPSLEINVTAGRQINILSNVKVAGETFDGGTLLFANEKVYNHLGMCMFMKTIQYENAYSNHLSYSQAENWLINNKYRINQIVNPLKYIISSKYGAPLKDSVDNIRWQSSNGNIIEIVVNRDVNAAERDPEFTRKYGCLPTYTILLIYVEGNNIPDY